VPLEEGPQLALGVLRQQADQNPPTTRMDADRHLVREVPHRLIAPLRRRHLRQRVLRDSRERRDVGHLLLGRGEPDEVRLLQDDVEQHDALERARHGGRTPEAGFGITDGLVQLPMADVVDARAFARSHRSRPIRGARVW